MTIIIKEITDNKIRRKIRRKYLTIRVSILSVSIKEWHRFGLIEILISFLTESFLTG